MKTSNKLLLATAVLILGYLLTYDLGLKAEYVKGDFRNQFYHMHRITVNNFTAIEHKAGNVFNIHIQKGPEYAVWLSNGAEKGISVDQHDKTLYFNCKDPKGHYRYTQETDVIITCPTINSITINTMLNAEDRYWIKDSKIVGFKQDSININASKLIKITLSKNTFDKLNAHIDGHDAGLTINKDNNINQANLQILGKSELQLNNPTITKANYTFSDSTKVILSGNNILHQLQK